MRIIYELSPSSMPILQRCIEIASQNSVENQWNVRFTRSNLLVGYEHLIQERPLQENRTPPSEQLQSVNNITDNIITPKSIDNEKYKEIVESNPILHIDYIIKESMNDETILITLANNLHDTNIEKFCQYVFENNLDVKFVEKFLLNFLLTYFKRQNSWLATDILVKVHKHYPEEFITLFQRIILDLEINSSILQEFVSTLDQKKQTDILKSLINMDFTIDVFITNIFTICTMYKSSFKDEKIHYFIFKNLEEASEKCVADKQYGRLLLTYLQNKNDNTKLTNLQKIVESHRSAFRRPCLNLLNEIIEKFNK